MEFQNDNIWIGAEHLTNDATFVEIAKQEFHHTSVEDTLENAGEYNTNRRDFLKYLGFGISAATLAACEIPLRRAVPYVTKPDSVVPGVANYYASSFVEGGDYNAILVKTREGRPIKIESNTLYGVEGSSARAQASVLGLYDTHRFQSAGQIADGKYTTAKWDDVDAAIKAKLAAGNATVLTGSVLSPTAKAAMAEFVAKYPNSKVVSYDAVSYNGILEANLVCFGDRVIPHYRFDNANVIVSFDADFLGTWVSPTEFNQQYAKGRRIENHEDAKMSRHIQVESRMSLTGSNADNRILVKPSEQGAAIATLYNEVAALTGGTQVSAPRVNETAAKALKKVAAELAANKGKSLVVSSSNNVGEQTLVNEINELLGNYGSTIDFANANLQRQGSDAAVQGLISEMNAGSVNALIVWGCNPVYDLPNGDQFKAGMAKVGLTVSLAGKMDETTAACKYVAPANHFLESWGDAEAKRGQITLIQPTIAQIFSTRQAELSLLRWADSANVNWGAEQPYYEYLKANWQKSYFKPGKYLAFQSFWDNTLHDGVFGAAAAPAAKPCNCDLNLAASMVTKPGSSECEISFYESVNVGDGRYADNPWLQELPDPVTRTVWGNHLSLPLKWNGSNDFTSMNDLQDGDIVEVTVNGKTEKVVVVRQFGQMEGTVALAVGYGRTVGGAGKGVGANVYPMMKMDKGSAITFGDATISKKAGVDKDFATVQYHHTMGITGQQAGYESKQNADGTINLDEKALGPGYFKGALTDRSVINKANLSELKAKVGELVEKREEFARLNAETLYPKHEAFTAGPHWKMYVDLNSCTGCAACTVACMSENNVPVVGKKEVHRHHEMTWLRIDRYYYGDVTNPNTVYQPMMCQHCDNAPCENVCPVNATNHSHDGLNQMTYNRCIGTRYCANNCPYKVRRFNWLDYTTADLFPYNENYKNDDNMLTSNGNPMYADNLVRMVLNPDVTVRSRGVIEKCSFCVQRIQEGKLTAKRDNRTIRDADVKTACQTACPTGAITFGNGNDPESTVSKKIENPMNYLVLEDINVAPNVVYSMKVNNRADLA
jgi:MoCo/4Fe-4S cofactor protein with predicted Tat translocation signal